jgi:NitT/TauT family transport system substrate-binding protein
MLQDALFARADWLAQEGNEDVAVRFLRASFKGWIYCRDNPDDCVQYVTDAGSTLGAGHQAWMMNEVNALIWPSADGIGTMSEDLWNQTVETAITAEIIGEEPPDDAFRTDLAEQALADIDGDKTGEGFQKAEIEVTPGGD